MTIHKLKLDNFSEFQNVISDSPANEWCFG